MLGANNTHTAEPKQTKKAGAHTRRCPATCSYASQHAPISASASVPQPRYHDNQRVACS